jgi:hypothetical protein
MRRMVSLVAAGRMIDADGGTFIGSRYLRLLPGELARNTSIEGCAAVRRGSMLVRLVRKEHKRELVRGRGCEAGRRKG